MCLTQGHNAVMPVRLEPLAPRSRVKHSTTEPLRSLQNTCVNYNGQESNHILGTKKYTYRDL